MTRPSQKDAEDAVRLLLKYIGEDIEREGIIDTPERVIRSYGELFSGYDHDPKIILNKQFHDICEFTNTVLLKSISFNSLCEHHMLPFSGFVDIAYLPSEAIIGVSKLARLVEIYSKRLQIQEKMTAEIAKALDENLQPKGVAVRIRASHTCMSARGIVKEGTILESYYYTGIYKASEHLKNEFLNMIKS